MTSLLLPLTASAAADPLRFGPKAANLAALGSAGLPIPGGSCLDAVFKNEGMICALNPDL